MIARVYFIIFQGFSLGKSFQLIWRLLAADFGFNVAIRYFILFIDTLHARFITDCCTISHELLTLLMTSRLVYSYSSIIDFHFTFSYFINAIYMAAPCGPSYVPFLYLIDDIEHEAFRIYDYIYIMPRVIYYISGYCIDMFSVIASPSAFTTKAFD